MNDSIIEILRLLFTRDLKKLKREIEAYENEDHLWIVEKSILNCAGNLCLHLVGNLNAYIGGELGKTGYVRQRDLEFSQKDVPKTELLKKVEDTQAMVDKVLSQLSPQLLKEEYPLHVFENKMTTEFFLIHLATHLNYHLGQINYHRRLLDLPGEG